VNDEMEVAELEALPIRACVGSDLYACPVWEFHVMRVGMNDATGRTGSGNCGGGPAEQRCRQPPEVRFDSS
jgi:hypothetical protein